MICKWNLSSLRGTTQQARRTSRRKMDSVACEIVILEPRRLLSIAAAAPTPATLTVPDLKTEQGALTAMLLAENINPGFSTYDATLVKTSMQAMRATIANRIEWDADHTSAPLFSRPTSSIDALSKPGQFPEFAKSGTGLDYSTSKEGVGAKKNIADMFAIANNPKDSRSAAYRAHIELAQSIAATDGSVDPYESLGGTYFWNTGASPSPLADAIASNSGLPGKILGNQFWTLKGTDLIFVIDSTGSMADDIDNVKTAADSTIAEIFKSKPNSRVAIVTYKDPGQTLVNLSFTDNQKEAVAAINKISVDGGGDEPEGVYSGILTAIGGDANNVGTWRAKPISRSVIVMGDAHAKDKDLKSQVQSALSDGSIEIKLSVPGESLKSLAVVKAAVTTPTTITLDAADIQLITISIGNNSSVASDFAEIAGLTKTGKALTTTDASTVVDTLLKAIDIATGTAGPVAMFASVPSIQTSALGIVTVKFDQDVTGVDLNDFVLTRNGTTVSLKTVKFTKVSASTYTLDLSSVTKTAGDYVLTLKAAGSGIVSASSLTPISADATLNWTYQAVSSFVVQNGEVQRSQVRYLDIDFASTIGLADLIASGRVKLNRSDLNGKNTTTTFISPSQMTLTGNHLRIDFGSTGAGKSLSTSGDGYFQVLFDLDGNGAYETAKSFYRLLGDFNGNRVVLGIDTIVEIGLIVLKDPRGDLDGNGIVNNQDLSYMVRLLGRRLNPTLTLNG